MDRMAGLSQPVIRELPLTGHIDEPRLSKYGEVTRDRGLRELEDLDNVAHAQLAGGQQTEDAKPGGIGERLEKGVDVGNGWIRQRG